MILDGAHRSAIAGTALIDNECRLTLINPPESILTTGPTDDPSLGNAVGLPDHESQWDVDGGQPARRGFNRTRVSLETLHLIDAASKVATVARLIE
jgi:hypothetical protein